MTRIKIEGAVKANYRRCARRARQAARAEARALKAMMKRIPHGARREGYSRIQRAEYARINGPYGLPSQLL